MFSSKHFCDFCGLEIEKNESASILWVPPARMCVRSLLLKGCKSCAAPLDVEIWAIVRPSRSWKKSFHAILSQLRKYHSCNQQNYTAGWLARQAKLSVPAGWRRNWGVCRHCRWNVKSTIRKARSSPTQTWIALVTLLATYKFAASLFFTVQTLFRTILYSSFQVLCRRHWWVEIEIWGKIGQSILLARVILAPCHCNFTGSTCGHLASKPSKLPANPGQHWTWEVCRYCPRNIKSTSEKAELPQHKPGSPSAHCWRPASLSCTAQTRTILDTTLQVLRSPLGCRDLGQNGPNRWHSLEE